MFAPAGRPPGSRRMSVSIAQPAGPSRPPATHVCNLPKLARDPRPDVCTSRATPGEPRRMSAFLPHGSGFSGTPATHVCILSESTATNVRMFERSGRSQEARNGCLQLPQAGEELASGCLHGGLRHSSRTHARPPEPPSVQRAIFELTLEAYPKESRIPTSIRAPQSFASPQGPSARGLSRDGPRSGPRYPQSSAGRQPGRRPHRRWCGGRRNARVALLDDALADAQVACRPNRNATIIRLGVDHVRPGRETLRSLCRGSRSP